MFRRKMLNTPEPSRRNFIKRTALIGLGTAFPGLVLKSLADETVTLPFENGERPLATYPQKRPLIRLTSRPPQLETPFSVFNEGIVTPNDAFFVRYHLTLSPPAMELLRPDSFRVALRGLVGQALSFSVAELKSQFEPVEITAVNQCSGNGRGFFQPRVPGGQLGNGAMGNAVWRGVRLKDLLDKVQVSSGARQVVFDGLDKPLLPGTPDFLKALDIDHARNGEVMLAYEMNGADLPWLNGYPLRLVVPGYYGTYWVKHIHEITVVDEAFSGYWMNPAYRIPDNDCACVEPGTTPQKTVPINRLNVRSFITSHADGAQVRSGETVKVKGIAFDGGQGISEVLFSFDDGRTWNKTELGKDLGKYSFREWTTLFRAATPGTVKLKCKASNRLGQSQPLNPLWNPAGYMRNVVETVQIKVA